MSDTTFAAKGHFQRPRPYQRYPLHRVCGEPTADRIRNGDVKAADLIITLASDSAPDSYPAAPASTSAGGSSAKVSIVGYRPALHPQEGLWTCDIGIDPGAAYFPFVQVVLARYQSHAVAGLELSTPVSQMIQIPPRRSGRVHFKSDRDIVLEVHGVGFRRGETGPEHEAQRHLTNVPLLNVRLLFSYEERRLPANPDNTIRWRHVLGSDGKPIEFLQVRCFRT